MGALHGAVTKGSVAAAKAALAAGADPNEKDKKGDTPLALAISRGKVPIVEVLLDAGARIQGGELSVAASTNNVALATVLLDRKAKVGWAPKIDAAVEDAWAEQDQDEDPWPNDDVPTDGGLTAVHHAAKHGHYDVLALLLAKDPKAARITTAKFKTAEDLASMHEGCVNLLRAIRKGKTVAQYEAEQSKAKGAAGGGALFLEQVDREKEVSSGEFLAPAAIKKKLDLMNGDWVWTTGAGFSLIYRKQGEQHAIEIGAKGAIRPVSPTLVAEDFCCAVHPEGARFLVASGKSVFEVDGATRKARKLVTAAAKIRGLGYLADGIFVVAGDTFAPYGPDGGKAWWSLALADVRDVWGTSTPLVVFRYDGKTYGAVFAAVTNEGLRLGAFVEEEDFSQLWTVRAPKSKQLESYLDTQDEWGNKIRIHNMESFTADGAIVKTWPSLAKLKKLPGLVVKR